MLLGFLILVLTACSPADGPAEPTAVLVTATAPAETVAGVEQDPSPTATAAPTLAAPDDSIDLDHLTAKELHALPLAEYVRLTEPFETRDVMYAFLQQIGPNVVANSGLPGQIAFHYLEDVGDLDSALYVMRADGAELHPFAVTPTGGTVPRLAPDGSQFVFERDNKLYLVGTDGGPASEISLPIPARNARWSSDSQTIVFSGETPPVANPSDPDAPLRPTHDIYTVMRDGSNLTRLTAFEGSDNFAALSSSGSYLIYRTLLVERSFGRLVRLDLASGARSVLHVQDGNASWLPFDEWGQSDPGENGPRWRSTNYELPSLSPDGSRLAFVMTQSNNGVQPGPLLVTGVDGGPVLELTEPFHPSALYEPTWSPDGRYLAFDYNVEVVTSDGLKPSIHNIFAAPTDGSKQVLQITDHRMVGTDVFAPVWWP
jgi:Tol biopolymer transport system component